VVFRKTLFVQGALRLLSAMCESDSTANKINGLDRYNGEPGSSVSIVSGHKLDDQAIKVRSPTEVKGFFL
jgi:hypothetical protein